MSARNIARCSFLKVGMFSCRQPNHKLILIIRPGAIRLPLASAHQTDLEGRAVAYWSSLVTESLEEATDAGRASFDRRLFFYDLITESLDYFQEAVDEQLEKGVSTGGESKQIITVSCHSDVWNASGRRERRAGPGGGF